LSHSLVDFLISRKFLLEVWRRDAGAKVVTCKVKTKQNWRRADCSCVGEKVEENLPWMDGG